MRTGASGPLQFNPLDLAQEAWKFQQHLAEGMRTLGQLPPDVHYGATEREEVWRDGKTVLYRFVGDKPATAKVPLLVSYALVNRPYMVDLQADRSLIKGLLERGEDVYIIDWGYPDRSDRFLTLEDYIERYIGGAVDHLRRTHAVPAVNLLGIDQTLEPRFRCGHMPWFFSMQFTQGAGHAIQVHGFQLWNQFSEHDDLPGGCRNAGSSLPAGCSGQASWPPAVRCVRARPDEKRD